MMQVIIKVAHSASVFCDKRTDALVPPSRSLSPQGPFPPPHVRRAAPDLTPPRQVKESAFYLREKVVILSDS